MAGLIALGVAWTACEPTPPPPAPTPKGPVDVSPSITIRPHRPAIRPPDGRTAAIPVTVGVAGADLDQDGLLVRLYLDGRPVVDTQFPEDFVFTDVRSGLHTVAARLLHEDGQPLEGDHSLAHATVSVEPRCRVPEDCEDDIPCTRQTCIVDRCEYKRIEGCCWHPMQCPAGTTCAGQRCEPAGG